MHGLSGIIAMNRPSAKVEDNHNRNCSFTGSVAQGIVLHSAKLRNTAFLNCRQAATFVQRFRRCGSVQAEVNTLIESYFA